MKKEFDIFLTSLMFFTRIPVPKRITHSTEMLQKSTRYFSWVGVLVGGVAGIFYLLCIKIFPASIAIFISMMVSILLTGAFHEDGFADTCDGFGGGWTKEKILLIMKDSRLGTYGVIGIISMLSFKFLLLQEASVQMTDWNIFFFMVSAHSVSRFAAVTLILQYKYVMDEKLSKSKPFANLRLQPSEFLIALMGAFLPTIFLSSKFLLALLFVTISRLYLGYYFQKWIGGYTGDCLGATQQVCEVSLYIGILIVWKFI